MTYEVFRQDVWDGRGEPAGDGWVPFAATAALGLGGVCGEIVWWRRVVPA